MLDDLDDDDEPCPLCCEDLDLSDRNFLPCPCGYRVCMWCWHHIRENLNGLCPACRTPYNADPHAFSAVDRQEIIKRNREQRAVEKKAKKTEATQAAALPNRSLLSGGLSSLQAGAAFAQSGVGAAPGIIGMPRQGSDPSNLAGSVVKQPAPTTGATIDRRQLHNYRVVQRNLVYVIGLPSSCSSEELLRRAEYFGQYGKIGKIVVHRSQSGPTVTCSAYITFTHKEDAKASIQVLDGFHHEGHILRASFGTSKYCNNFIRGLSCNNQDCVYLHELGNDEDRFTKAEIQAGQSKLVPTPGINQVLITGMGGPSGSGKRPTGEPIMPAPVFLQDIAPVKATGGSTKTTGTGASWGTALSGSIVASILGNSSGSSNAFDAVASEGSKETEAGSKSSEATAVAAAVAAATAAAAAKASSKSNGKEDATAAASKAKDGKDTSEKSTEKSSEKPSKADKALTRQEKSQEAFRLRAEAEALAKEKKEASKKEKAGDKDKSVDKDKDKGDQAPSGINADATETEDGDANSSWPGSRPDLQAQVTSCSFNGLGRCAVFTVPTSSFSGTSVWPIILHAGASGELDHNPFGQFAAPLSELLDLTIPPVDAAGYLQWPKPDHYYHQPASSTSEFSQSQQFPLQALLLQAQQGQMPQQQQQSMQQALQERIQAQQLQMQLAQQQQQQLQQREQQQLQMQQQQLQQQMMMAQMMQMQLGGGMGGAGMGMAGLPGMGGPMGMGAMGGMGMGMGMGGMGGNGGMLPGPLLPEGVGLDGFGGGSSSGSSSGSGSLGGSSSSSSSSSSSGSGGGGVVDGGGSAKPAGVSGGVTGVQSSAAAGAAGGGGLAMLAAILPGVKINRGRGE